MTTVEWGGAHALAIICSGDVAALFARWELAWSGRDPAAFAPLCVEDVHYEDPLTPEPLTGPRALGRHAERLWRKRRRRERLWRKWLGRERRAVD